MKSMRLDLAHGGHIHGLDEVLELGHLLAQLLDGDLVILHHAHHLQFVDPVPHRHQLGSSPYQPLHLDGLARLEHLVHVCLVVPGLHRRVRRF